MAEIYTPIQSEIDLAAEGRQLGYLRLPHSVHRSAYGWIPIPIASIKNGSGPKVLLMAGNHGDEYEGQVALAELARELEAGDIRGQVVILPMANQPAARAGLRTSPIDDGNLNRLFPGDPHGSPTQIIAHYIEHVLLPGCDYLLDIHSGGSSLIYQPTLMTPFQADANKREQVVSLLQSFGFVNALFYPPDDSGQFSSSAAARNGVTAITAEVAGGGAISAEPLARLRVGIRRFLSTLGLLEASPGEAPTACRVMQINGQDAYCYAASDGLFEPLVALGDEVVCGQPAALIHQPMYPDKVPVSVSFEQDGVVVCMRQPAQVVHGDCLFHLACETDD